MSWLTYVFLVVFTGSNTVGKIVSAAAAKHLTPVTLEVKHFRPSVSFSLANQISVS